MTFLNLKSVAETKKFKTFKQQMHISRTFKALCVLNFQFKGFQGILREITDNTEYTDVSFDMKKLILHKMSVLLFVTMTT